MSKFKEPGFWIGLAIIFAFVSGAAIASDPRREPPKPSPWLVLPYIENVDDRWFYPPVTIYAQCDGATRVFIAVPAQARYNSKAPAVSITAVPGGCERTKAEEPR